MKANQLLAAVPAAQPGAGLGGMALPGLGPRAEEGRT